MSVTEHLEGLASAINDGRPLVVLMGQDAWRVGARPDPAVLAALKRAERLEEDSDLRGLVSLLSAEPLPDDFFQWLADQYLRQVEAEWFEPIARLPLNAFFTTSLDPTLSRALRVGGRDVEAVLSKSDTPAAPRHRRNLHLSYLFGRAGEANPSEAPPKSTQELRRRTALHANALLARLVETTTSLGVLAIDGLTCGRDWLSAESLYGVLSAFKPGQVFWFGWDSSLSTGDAALMEELAAPSGPITFVTERLSSALRALTLAGRIEPLRAASLAATNAVTIGESLLEIEPSTRLKTSTAASIVDDTWLAPLPVLGEDALFDEFRRFHGQVEEARRLAEGVRRGFAIERGFETRLRDRVQTALKDAPRLKEPILVHGQSGTGKSIALARLAFSVRNDRRYPVLVASRASRLPAVDELDEFCMRAEDAGAEATLVVCDANAQAARYRDLLRGFQSRGRRVVVVGSAYRLIDQKQAPGDGKHLIEAPPTLDDEEAANLTAVLRKHASLTYTPSTSRLLLPAVYRILPEVRPRLAAGLAREARVAEDDLRSRGTTIRQGKPQAAGALGQALMDAGLIDPKELLDQRLQEFMGTLSDAASKAIDYVMVPGKLDCPVPINLLMRAVGGSESLVDIASLFSGIDLFRWSTNDEDDVFIHPRIRIEAELVTARRLGTSAAEAQIAVDLLKAANPTTHGSCERRFVLDLVHRLGPDGPYGPRYADHYLDVARALTEMRVRRGLSDPSLMLQEARLRRRVFRDARPNERYNPASILDEARQIVDLALDEFGAGRSPGLRRISSMLRVERAAIYGFRAVQQLQSGASQDETWQYYEAARDAARSALFSADAYHAIDVSLWIPRRLLEDGNWDSVRKAELTADIWDGLERVDADDLDADQRGVFEEQRFKVSKALENDELELAALQALEVMGSSAGLFLQARAIGGDLWGRGMADDDERERARHVVGFLTDKGPRIREDARCLRYLLRATWISAAGSYLFGGERLPLPSSEADLRELLDIVDTLANIEGSLGDPRTEYLRAVLMWRLQRENAAREIWRALSQDTAFNDPRRIVRHHVWSESGGKPRVFHGRVVRDDLERGRAKVQVDDIRQEIEILQRDFPDLELLRGASIRGGFYIAFNFIGPIAEPLFRRGGGR